MDIKRELYKLQDQEYQKFHGNIVPGLDNHIGVRVPELRKLAKKLVKDKVSLDEIGTDTYEEVLLRGFYIGYSKVDVDTRLQLIEAYLPLITNWAICDGFVSTLKFTKDYKEEVFNWLMQYVHGSVYEVRFVLVMLLTYFMDDEYIECCYKVFDCITNDDYYVKMALAWAISIAYIKYTKRTMDYLLFAQIDGWTYNKAISKICDSYRVSKEEKEELKKLKVRMVL